MKKRFIVIDPSSCILFQVSSHSERFVLLYIKLLNYFILLIIHLDMLGSLTKYPLIWLGYFEVDLSYFN